MLFRKAKTASKIREADTYVSELKGQRRRRRNFLIGSGIFLAIGLIGVGASWVVAKSSLFQIRAWEVHGNQFTDEEDIRNFLNVKILTASAVNTVLGFQNMMAWSSTEYDNHAAELPRVKEITIDKQYLKRTISINVEERVPFGIWCDGNDQSICFWFDTDGVLLDAAPAASGNLIPVVNDYSGKYLRSQIKAYDSEGIKNLITIFEALRAAKLNVREVRLENRDLQEIKVVLGQGPELYLSLRFPANEVAPVIATLKNGTSRFSDLQYVDFRVEHRAYYK